ncbi:hypothetical protein LUZ63_018911 [Rhynchospora breviuscula]|uniref:Uncharacterized protein n=1 Tax=Rhynchospora breviuscula TaxID=2022672 RepID=A0A9Q0HIB8_9POAL|nr:hypothetical protein LUZ63_018911 [Rhynchospora breviuscula]
MAPHGEAPVATINPQKGSLQKSQMQRRISIEGLQRAMSDLSFELLNNKEAKNSKLSSISEVEEAKCTCCGMSEECTQEYISRVKERFSGKWICGICSAAVKEELEKNGGDQEEALRAHVSVCVKFNRLGRTQPVLSQAQAMKEIWKKRSKSISPRETDSIKKGAIPRSSSCIPAISKDMMQR